MVGAFRFAAPVGHKQADVEEPALDFCFAVAHDLERALAKADGREAWDAGEAFLRARVYRVDAPCVDVDGRSAQCGHGVDDGETVVLEREPHKGFGVGFGAGRGFRLYEGEDLRVGIGLERFFDLIDVDRRLSRRDIDMIADVLRACLN